MNGRNSARAEFDLEAPLPGPGVHILEASAGTGKTYSITKLVTRYIAEGAATIDQCLVMTFSRSAAQELRDRVRRDLASFNEGDPIQRERVAAALANLDQATISTTHQFCLDAYSRLGVLGDADQGETTGADLSGLIEQVAEDVYLRLFATAGPPTEGGATRLTPRQAFDLARMAVLDPVSELVPRVDLDPEQQRRIQFAQIVRREVVVRQRRDLLVSFDDLVIRLLEALRDEGTGPKVGQRLRDRYRVVLIDEFQDTDPSQWEIVQRAFTWPTVVILIGDPKQGIYAFRGADIHSYLAAEDMAVSAQTLGTNHRSDRAVVDGLFDLLGGLGLGSDRITVHKVAAKHGHERMRRGPVDDRRVRLRVFTPTGLSVPATRAHLAEDVAADIVRTLHDEVQLLDGTHWRPVAPKDFAVIVRTNQQAELVAQVLRSHGLPAVINSRSSVFGSSAARAWLRVLRAIEVLRPQTMRAAALTPFFAASATDLATDDGSVMETIAELVRGWRRTFDRRGMAAMTARIVSESGVYEQALAGPDGERTVTDLRHISVLLHEEQQRFGRGITGLVDWLAEQVQFALAQGDEDSEALTRRLETDADAVRVVTIHSCKGLEYMITYIPFGWQAPQFNDPVIVCHEEGRRIMDVRVGKAPGREERTATRQSETRGEDLRMLYVALTRGKHEVVVHYAGHPRTTKASPLHRALSALQSGQSLPAPDYPLGEPPVSHLTSSRHVAVEEVPDTIPDQRWQALAGPAPEHPLRAAPFDRAVDDRWRRLSFTRLTQNAHHDRDDSKANDEGGSQATVEPGLPPTAAATDAGRQLSLYADLPAGAALGNLVHATLEHVDPTVAELEREVARVVADQLAQWPVPGAAAERIVHALVPTIRTPLGPLAGDRRLADISPRDRLPELGFELPLQQGHGSTATLKDIGSLLLRHLPETDSLHNYAAVLAGGGVSAAMLRGFLNGSIDAVLRTPGDDGEFRYLVVDYKTNRLGGADSVVWDYRPDVLPAAMAKSHYPLQSLLYSAALHRYLRWRLPGYEPHRHLGGILYLFVRGMAGPDTPRQSGVPCGVFSWHPPAAMIVELSDLLSGRAS